MNKIHGYLFAGFCALIFILSVLIFNNNNKQDPFSPESFDPDLVALKNSLPDHTTINYEYEGNTVYSLYALRYYLSPILVFQKGYQSADTTLFISYNRDQAPPAEKTIIWQLKGAIV